MTDTSIVRQTPEPDPWTVLTGALQAQQRDEPLGVDGEQAVRLAVAALAAQHLHAYAGLSRDDAVDFVTQNDYRITVAYDSQTGSLSITLDFDP